MPNLLLGVQILSTTPKKAQFWVLTTNIKYKFDIIYNKKYKFDKCTLINFKIYLILKLWYIFTNKLNENFNFNYKIVIINLLFKVFFFNIVLIS